MNVPWDILIAAAIELLKASLEKQSDSVVRGRLMDPGFVEWLRFRAALVKRGIRGQELTAAMEAARRYVYAPKGDEEQSWADDLLSQARAA